MSGQSIGQHGPVNGTHPAGGPPGGGGYGAYVAQALAHEATAKYYGIALGSLMGIFVVCHISRAFLHLQGRRGTIGKTVASPFRLWRKVAIRKVPKFTSLGHLCLILSFLIINIGLTFFKMNFQQGATYFAKRAGWMAICNTALTFFLSMKNNPIAYLTGYSHERLNVLHRWTGRSVWVYSALHVFIMSAAFMQKGGKFEFTQPENIYGIMAFAAYTTIIASSLQIIRRRFYEYFYLLHISMFILVIVGLGLHHPEIYQNVIILAGSFWCFDRLVRVGRALYYSRGNTATIYPLAGGSTKVVLSKPATFQPGSHGFLAIPSIRLFQSHPFTISSCSDVEFIVRAQKGFTKDLYEHAEKNPGAKLSCGFDGPYGAVPDYRRMNHVILFAGGSGGSFTFSVATDIARNIARSSVVSLEFVWVVRDKKDILLYESELEELRRCPIVSLRIFITGTAASAQTLVTSHPIPNPPSTPETPKPIFIAMSCDEAGERNPKVTAESIQGSPTTPSATTSLEKALELSPRSSSVFQALASTPRTIESILEYGRPNIKSIVHETTQFAKQDDLVGVAACGPTGLMRVVRNAVGEEIQISGTSISLHCEQFSWG